MPSDFSAPPPPSEAGKTPVCGFTQRFKRSDQGAASMQIQAKGATMDLLARTLGNILRRQVANDTGISGSFDFALEYAPDSIPTPLAADPLQSQPATTGASVFTALQEQLGLQLRSAKSAVDVLVVDNAEPSSDN